MSNIDKQALRDDMRQAREQLAAAENNLIDSECHVAELEESLRDKQTLLEAAEKRIAELERANVAQDDHINQQQDRIEQLEKGHQEAAKQINSWRRLAKQNIAERGKDISELEAARQRIAELEARTVKLPEPISVLHRRDFTDAHRAIYAYPEAEVNAALAAAGIKVKES